MKADADLVTAGLLLDLKTDSKCHARRLSMSASI